MKLRFALLVSIVLAGILAFAQDQAPAFTSTFKLDAQAISLPGNHQTVPGTVIGGTFSVTKNFALRYDNLISPEANMLGFFGGFEYNLPALSKTLNNASPFNGNNFQFYVTSSFGIDRLSPANAPAVQHYAALAGGGVRYDPTANGKFTVNLAEVRYAKLPGYQNNTVIVSSGLNLHF